MARLAEKYRVRTVLMGAIESIAAGATIDKVSQSFVFQDDVTIIGCELMGEFLVADAHSNADGDVNSIVELTRQGQRAQPGTILWVPQHAVWNAGIAISGELRKAIVLMFPPGYGIEVDEGESLNLLSFATWIGTGTMPFYPNCIVYYVER